MWTGEGDRKLCRLGREVRWGVDCLGGREGLWTAEAGMKGCELVWEAESDVDC